MHKIANRALTTALAALPLATLAATAPPALPFDGNRAWPATYVRLPASNLRLGALALQFESPTLPAIAKAVGQGKIAHQGDAGASVYWLCYSTSTSRIWLVSSGEMGGASHTLTSVSMLWQARVTPDADCPALPDKFRPVTILEGLEIGQPASRFNRALAAPTHAYRAWRMYDHAGKVLLDGGCLPAGFDRGNWLWYEVAGNRVVRLVAGQVTSC